MYSKLILEAGARPPRSSSLPAQVRRLDYAGVRRLPLDVGAAFHIPSASFSRTSPTPPPRTHPDCGCSPSRTGLLPQVRRRSPCKAIGRAIRQQVNRLIAFQIDDDCPVALALTPRPVISTDCLDAGSGPFLSDRSCLVAWRLPIRGPRRGQRASSRNFSLKSWTILLWCCSMYSEIAFRSETACADHVSRTQERSRCSSQPTTRQCRDGCAVPGL